MYVLDVCLLCKMPLNISYFESSVHQNSAKTFIFQDLNRLCVGACQGLWEREWRRERERASGPADLFTVCLPSPLCFGWAAAQLLRSSRAWLGLRGHLKGRAQQKVQRDRETGTEVNKRAPFVSSSDRFYSRGSLRRWFLDKTISDLCPSSTVMKSSIRTGRRVNHFLFWQWHFDLAMYNAYSYHLSAAESWSELSNLHRGRSLIIDFLFSSFYT